MLLRRTARSLREKPTWMSEGERPDYRFSLANERTFLAWIRTSLAMLAGATAIVQLVPKFTVPGTGTVLGLALSLAGLLLAGYAYPRWAGNERAMRHDQPLPHTPVLLAIAATLSAIGLVVVALVLTHNT